MKDDKQQQQDFVQAKRNKYFKMDKQTKRTMASLGKYGPNVKLNAQEQKEAEVKLENINIHSFKALMLDAEVSALAASIGELYDPLWKPKKDKQQKASDEEQQTEGTGKFRKGKRSIKMRKEPESAQKE